MTATIETQYGTVTAGEEILSRFPRRLRRAVREQTDEKVAHVTFEAVTDDNRHSSYNIACNRCHGKQGDVVVRIHHDEAGYPSLYCDEHAEDVATELEEALKEAQ